MKRNSFIETIFTIRTLFTSSFTCFNKPYAPCPMSHVQYTTYNMLLIQLIHRSPHLWCSNRNKSGITSYYVFSYDFQAKFFMIYFAVVWQTSDIQFYGLRFTYYMYICSMAFGIRHSVFGINNMFDATLSTFNAIWRMYDIVSAMHYGCVLCTL